MDLLLLPLLMLAIGIGWWLGQQEKKKAPQSHTMIDADGRVHYAPGLAYLLRDKSHDEVESFVRSLAVSPHTLDTHLALGGLFRRRGESDKAIQIHQNLLESAALEAPWPARIKVELAMDYRAAGILGRAEDLLGEVYDHGGPAEQVEALLQLLEIYQQESDWEHAILTATRLLKRGHAEVAMVLAHFYCEIAEEALAAGNEARVRQKLRQALSVDPRCARAYLLRAELEKRLENYPAAVADLELLEERAPEFFSEGIGRLVHCCQEGGMEERLVGILRRSVEARPTVSAVLALAEILRKDGDDHLVTHFIAGQLRRRPSIRGLRQLIELQLGTAQESARESLEILLGLTSQLLEAKPVYRCHHCGFSGKELHWRCPGCKEWGRIHPIQGLEGE